MTDEQQLRYARQVEDARDYTALYTNEEFQRFKKEQFDEPMARLIESVMDSNLLDMEEIRDNIVKYQTLRKAYVDSFANKIDTATKAREMLNNQRKPKELS